RVAGFLGRWLLAGGGLGPGTAAHRLPPGDPGLRLRETPAAPAAGLYAIILVFGPVRGAHLTPAVTLVDAATGGLTWRVALTYLPAQLLGCCAGAVLANLMYAAPAASISTPHRPSPPPGLPRAP